MLTQNEALSIFSYDPETGTLFNKINRKPRAKKGEKAGSKHINGYVHLSVKGKRYLAHRVVWLIIHGKFPRYGLDHINGNPEDNRLINLREVPQSENVKNSSLPKNNTTGELGVYKNKTGKKWRAQIQVNKKSLHLGTFKNKQDALTARKEAELNYNFHMNHGKNNASS